MKALTTLWVLGMFLATPALADDVEDVKAAEMAARAAEAAGNTLGFYKNMVPEFSIPPPPQLGCWPIPPLRRTDCGLRQHLMRVPSMTFKSGISTFRSTGTQPSAPIMSWQRFTDPRGSQSDGICE